MKKSIQNYEDLADLLGANEPTEASVSHRVYKDTSCGAWAEFITEDLVHRGKARWHLVLGPAITGVYAETVKRGGKWYEGRDDWMTIDEANLPAYLTEFLNLERDTSNNTSLHGRWKIGGLNWSTLQANVAELPECKLHGVVLTVVLDEERVVGQRVGVAFGSIVEGVDQTTETYKVFFPCHPIDIYKAIEKVEEEAHDIWMETHGCPYCWSNPEHPEANFDWDAGDYVAVDENCPVCHGEGMCF